MSVGIADFSSADDVFGRRGERQRQESGEQQKHVDVVVVVVVLC